MVTDMLTEMQHNDPAQYTVLGWVKIHTELVSLKTLRKQLLKVRVKWFKGKLWVKSCLQQIFKISHTD